MPVLPPSTLLDIPKKDRAKVERLQHERAVLGYAFSYEKLVENIRALAIKVGDDRDYPSTDDIKEVIQDSIVAFNDEDCKTAKSRINDKLQGIYLANGIKTLRDVDPFGRKKDYILMESSTSIFKRDRAIEIAVAEYKIPASKMQAIFEAATEKRPFTTLQARDVKENNGSDE